MTSLSASSLTIVRLQRWFSGNETKRHRLEVSDDVNHFCGVASSPAQHVFSNLANSLTNKNLQTVCCGSGAPNRIWWRAMDISFLDSTASSAVNQILGFDRFDNLFTRRLDQVSVSGTVPISSLIFDAVAPPPVKPRVNRKTNKTVITRRKRRLRKQSMDGGGEDDGGYDGGDDDNRYGGGGWNFGGRGGGWNFGGYGENNWDDWSFSSASDPASDFVHEVVCWIALSNCVHFAFKKVARGIGELIGQHGREKVPLRLGSLC